MSPPTFATLLQVVADWGDVTIEQIQGESRLANIVRPRQMLMYAAREWLQWSYPQIGRALGRDHTTIMYAHRRVRARLAEDPGARRILAWIHHAWDPGATREETPIMVATELDVARASVDRLMRDLLETVKDRDDLSDRLEMALAANAARAARKCPSCGAHV